MPQNDLYQKFINFDLSTKELLKHFPNGTAKPYGELKKFFLARDFEHRQYSGYLSKNFLDKFDISFIAKELGQFSWLKDTMLQVDVSSVVSKDNFDIMGQIVDSIDGGKSLNKVQEQRIKASEESLQRKYIELQKETKYYELNKKNFLPDAKRRIQDKILNIGCELLQNNFTIDEQTIDIYTKVVIERNGGREI